MTRFDELGPNSGLVEELYQRYLENPASVDAHWRTYFAERAILGRPAAVRETAPATCAEPPAAAPIAAGAGQGGARADGARR